MVSDMEAAIRQGKETFAECVCAYRKKKRFTQQQLADAAKVTQATISGIENGKENPSMQVIERIADALEVPPCALFGAKSFVHALHDSLSRKQVGDVVTALLEKGSSDPNSRWVTSEFLDRAVSQLR